MDAKDDTQPIDGTLEHDEAEQHDTDAERSPEEALRAERDEFESKWLRALADYQNFQRRAADNEREARRQGAAGVLLKIIPVLDSFDLALEQEAPEESQQFVSGVRAIRDGLLRALQSQGVEVIAPAPGDEFDPNRHEALMREASPDADEGSVARTLQPGYALDARIVRPAKVAVSDGAPADGE